MQSPFPGMDPYLERHWGDVHQRLVTYICDQLQSKLPADLRARMEQRVFVETSEWRHEYYPDVRVIERPSRTTAAGAMAVAEPSVMTSVEENGLDRSQPLLIDLDVEPLTEGFIEIVDVKSGHRVITSIEVLSPANKNAGEGQRLYLQKRYDMKQAGVNTVEIDVLRGGQRVLMIHPDQIPPWHRTDYQVCVWRAAKPSSVGVYRAALREKLPLIAIPLRPDDPDALLDLQSVVQPVLPKRRLR